VPATGIGGPSAYTAPRRHLKKSWSHDCEHHECSSDSTVPGNTRLSDSIYFAVSP
jgi:hypothetical protein